MILKRVDRHLITGTLLLHQASEDQTSEDLCLSFQVVSYTNASTEEQEWKKHRCYHR